MIVAAALGVTYYLYTNYNKNPNKSGQKNQSNLPSLLALPLSLTDTKKLAQQIKNQIFVVAVNFVEGVGDIMGKFNKQNKQ